MEWNREFIRSRCTKMDLIGTCAQPSEVIAQRIGS